MLQVKSALGTLFLFIVVLSYSQQDSLNIRLKNDQTISTSWLKLNEHPLFQNALFVLIIPGDKQFK